jgi:intracellular sulfur oxidation DsrE/DsrF family protein
MNKPSLVIGVAYDGVAQDRNGRDRVAFENLVKVLLAYEKIPATLCFYTEGVRWVTSESPFVEELREIHKRGADIVACRSTMAQAGLLNDLAVGRLTTADHIDDMLLQAEHALIL